MEQKETVQRSRRKPLVLWVEDDDQTFETYSQEIRRHYDLQRIRTGIAAVNWMETRDDNDELPNLVVMSYALPDITGIELMAVLKVRYPQLMFMMLSNHHSEDALVEAFRLGALGALLTSTMTPAQVGRRLRENVIRRRGQVG